MLNKNKITEMEGLGSLRELNTLGTLCSSHDPNHTTRACVELARGLRR
jgi:hypothetical protein